MAESVKKNRVPEDVLIDILIALPIKSLLRFRSLSKSWNSHISDKDFISAYLTQPKPSLLLRRWQNRQESYSLHLDNESLDRSLQFQNLPFRSEADCFDIIGYCNGVVCLSDIHQGRPKSLILWNPSIRKHLNLALPKLCGPHGATWGFGFDLPSNDYRVVRVARQVSSKREFPMEFQVAFNGILHWFVYREENDNRRSFVDVWFMREYGVRNSWNRLYTVQVDGFTRSMVFRKNGEILMRKHGSYEVVSCDPQTRASRNFRATTMRPCRIFCSESKFT
ncbi:hypothetical protein H0E87_019712 [Populus deltoides]|uniref:F-box domain-containing protein n=1 Tax=Populus deltoides TaxID=3696 RepID=A0A8T2XWB4_POPDE|nr:hypothetical protein H0E87_019712 [Populus deltoides]